MVTGLHPLNHPLGARAQIVIEDWPDPEPQRLNNLQQNRHVRLAINGEVQCFVQRDKPRLVGRVLRKLLAKRIVNPLNLLQCLSTHQLRRTSSRLPFQIQPNTGDLAKLADRQHRHPDIPIGRHLQRLLSDQPMHRLTHRHHTYAERIGNGPERQLLPGHDTATDQQITKLGINVRTESLADHGRHEFG